MSKTLFTKYFAYNEDGCKVSDEAHSIIGPLFKKYREAGYSPREVSAIYHAVVGICEMPLDSGQCFGCGFEAGDDKS